MLTEILNSHNVKRLTTSPWAALESASQVQSFMKVGHASRRKQVADVQGRISDLMSKGILSKFQQDSEEKIAQSVFEMTESKQPVITTENEDELD